MRMRWYGTVAASVALAAVSGCADASRLAGTQPPASLAAPTALSQPSGGPVNLVATAPAPPPPTAMLASPGAPPPTSSPPPTSAVPSVTAPTASGPPGGDTPGPEGQLYSKHAAQLRLDALLASLTLPPGAVRQTSAVPELVKQEDSYMGMLAATVDTWWRVPGTKDAAIAYVKAHPPAGFTIPDFVGVARHESVLTIDRPLTAKGPQTLWEVGIAQDGDHVDLRVQLQVGYLPTRTAIETIPASVRAASGVYQPPTEVIGNAKPAPRREAVLSASDVRVIAAALNGVDAQTPIEHSCPAPDGEEAWFTFAYGGRTVSFHVALNGCGGVEVVAGGVPQPELSLGDTIFDAVHTALHVTKAENPLLP